MKIKFEIDEKSYLNNINNNVKAQELLTVIGNIIENSIEELRMQNDGWIYCGIFEEEKIKIVVKNNGRKIDEDTKKKIFERGYSTKGEGRGFGLYNIKTIVNNLGGELKLTSDEITVWEIIV